MKTNKQTLKNEGKNEMKYEITVRLNCPTEAGDSEVYFTCTEDKLNNLKKDAKRVNYDGSLVMENNDIIEWEKI